MKKNNQILVLLLVILVLLCGCANEQMNVPTTTSTPTESIQPSTPEATQPSLNEPRIIQANEVQKLMNDCFRFGAHPLVTKYQYVWYPQGFVEMQFEYKGTHFYARAYQGNADIACWNHPWVKPYLKSDDIPGLLGDIRKCKINDTFYTSVIWYDTEKNLTYTLDWTGAGESYTDVAAAIFLDINNMPIPMS